MISIPILILVLVVLLVIYIIGENKKKPLNFPPGPPILPLWGSYWFLLLEHFTFPFKGLISMHKKYKSDVVGLYLGNQPAISCFKYHLCKELQTREEFVGRNDNAIARSRGRGFLTGIFFADGNYWKDQRWFSLRHMRDYGFGRRDVGMEDTAADEVRSLLEFFQSKPKPCDADICTERGIVLMPDVIFGPALNTVHHTLSSTHFENYKEMREVARAATRFLNSIDSTGNCIVATPWLRHIAPDYFGWTSSVRDQQILLDFAGRVVKEHQETYKEDHLRDFIDVYIKEMNYLEENDKTNTSFSELQLINTVVDYMFPSPVGVGHTLNFLFAYLILQPDIQVKLQEEMDRVVGRARLPTLDDRKDMHYMEATLREALRKDPIVPLSLSRRCLKDTTFGGYFIPKDTVVLPNLWGMHNDPEFWGDPEVFRPERFIEPDGTLQKKDYTTPFGAGKRLCAGETFARHTMFLFVAGILQNFSLRTPEGRPKPDLSKQINGITLTMNPYWVECVPRA